MGSIPAKDQAIVLDFVSTFSTPGQTRLYSRASKSWWLTHRVMPVERNSNVQRLQVGLYNCNLCGSNNCLQKPIIPRAMRKATRKAFPKGTILTARPAATVGRWLGLNFNLENKILLKTWSCLLPLNVRRPPVLACRICSTYRISKCLLLRAWRELTNQFWFGQRVSGNYSKYHLKVRQLRAYLGASAAAWSKIRALSPESHVP